jgi:hypothetical protein
VQILLVPVASCAHVPPPKTQDSDLHRPMAWFPGAYVLRALSWAHVRVWGAAWRGCHTPAWPGSAHFARSSYVNRALFGTSTSADPCCSLQRLPRRTTVSHDRIRKAFNVRNAAIGLQRSMSRIKHDLHRRNAQSAHSPAKPACGSRAKRLPRRAHVPMTGRAGHTRLGTTPSVGGGRCPEF